MGEDSSRRRAEEHVEHFNACVDSGNWSSFVASYADDAVLEIVGAGIPTLRGRDAIAGFYASYPPREHMHPVDVTAEMDTVTVRFTWDSGERAELTARWRDDLVAHVRLTSRS